MFTTEEVADYYNTTQNHYFKWWNLKHSLSLHYGIWSETTSSIADSLENTNRILLNLAAIAKTDKVLDAGCGVGGAAFYINNKTGATVKGISLSKKQIDFAQLKAKELGVNKNIAFHIMDYTQTSFSAESFDVIWACESVSSATNKSAFIKEAFRLLKKGGRLILSDFFVPTKNQVDPHNWIKKWGDTWGISHFSTEGEFLKGLVENEFIIKENLDFTTQIIRSAKRMYYASLIGAFPATLYNLTHPKVSRFAKTHYLSGYYQYKALKAKLWKYKLLLAVKQ